MNVRIPGFRFRVPCATGLVAALMVLGSSSVAFAQDSYRDRGQRYERATQTESPRVRTRTDNNSRPEYSAPVRQSTRGVGRAEGYRDYDANRYTRPSYRGYDRPRSSTSVQLGFSTGYQGNYRPYQYVPSYSPYSGYRDYGYRYDYAPGYAYRPAYSDHSRYYDHNRFDYYRPAYGHTEYSYSRTYLGYGGYGTRISRDFYGYDDPYRVAPRERVSFSVTYGVPGVSYYPSFYCPPPRPTVYREYRSRYDTGTRFNIRYDYRR